MTYSRSLTLSCALFAGSVVALAQTPPAPLPAPAPPRPPSVEAPQAVPTPRAIAIPAPAVAPVAPVAVRLEDLDYATQEEIREKVEAAREKVERLRGFEISPAVKAQIDAAMAKADFQFDFDQEEIRAQVQAAKEQLRALEPQMAWAKGGFAFAPQITTPPMPPKAPMPAQVIRRSGSADSAYRNGQSALDNRHWDEAVEYFGQVVSRGGTRSDGALYWKAYALAKLGRSAEATATIAELRKSYSGSRWLDDAKALEIEVQQAGGKPISPEAEQDDELKLLALEGLSHSDPERAFPALEQILKKPSSSPKLKRNAVYVLANNNSPKAQSLLEQIARGGGNPDLQVKAISYMPRNTNSGTVLAEIYAASNDAEVKRAVLNALISARDKDRLLSVAKNEKNPELRSMAIGYLGGIPGNPELWQLYQADSTTEGREQILSHMYNNGNLDKLLDLLKTEKDPKLRAQLVRVVASYKTQQVSDALLSIYSAETENSVKQAIIDNIFSQRNGETMVKLAKAEKDPKLKMRMIERLSNMRNCKECTDYMLEILNR